MGDRPLPSAVEMPRFVVHRRNDGSPCFSSDEDYLVYLDCLKEAADRDECAIHAYALMPREVQLLVSPDSETRLVRVLRSVSGRYVEFVNTAYQRTGRFWEQGAQVTVIGNQQEVPPRYRAIELAPVRARLAGKPEDYRWSSHGHHACGGEDPVIRDHPWYLNLGTTHLARQLAYHEWFRQPHIEAAAAAAPAAYLHLALGENRRDDVIQRPVRGLGWRSVDSGRRVASGPQPPAGGPDARDNAFGIEGVPASAARRFASKEGI